MSRLKKVAIAAVAIAGLIVLAMPLLLSSERVKSSIEARLTELSGRSVVLDGSSSPSFYPYLGISYSRVTLGRTENEKPLIVTDGIKATVGLFSALTGNPSISEISLVRPSVELVIDKNGKWLLGDEAGSSWLNRKTNDGSGVKELGLLEIVDGIVRITDQRSGSNYEITAINGQLNWPDIGSNASVEITSVWRGEIVKLDGAASKLAELLRGGTSPATLVLSSKPATISFSGEIAAQSGWDMKGDLIFSSPSMRRFSQWTDQPIGLVSLLGPAKLSGAMTAGSGKMTVESASLDLGEHSAKGRLQFEKSPAGKIAIGGTLAFNTLELPNLQDFSAINSSSTEGSSPIIHGADFDLRLSAETATSGPVSFEGLAATALVKEGSASFDIGQAKALGGLISTTLTYSSPKGPAIGADITLQDVDLDQLSTLYGKTNVVLAGKGNARFKLQSATPDGGDALQHLNGEGRIDGVDGKIVGVDLAKIIASTDAPKEPASDEVLSGTTSYNNLDLNFFIANGVVFFKDSQMKATGYDSELEGRGDLVSRSLALRGRLIRPLPIEDGATIRQTVTLPFFIGGTASEPLFISLPTTRSEEAIPQPEEPKADQ